MKAEHLKIWLRSATREKYPDTETWDKVISIIEVAFQEGYIPEALMWTTIVLITKGSGDYRGIGVCTSIINSWIQSYIVLHEVLQGFRQERGTRTAIMEAKMEQQLARIVHKPLFQVLLDVRKACNSLDQGRCMEILREYGLGPRLQQLLQMYWDGQRVVPKSGKYYGKHLSTRRGVIQGYPISPTLLIS